MGEVKFTLKLLAVFWKSVVRIELEAMHHLLSSFVKEDEITAFAAVERHRAVLFEVVYMVLHCCQS